MGGNQHGVDKRGHLLSRKVEYTLTGAREGGNKELLSHSCRVPIPGHEKVLKGDGSDGCTVGTSHPMQSK